MSRKKHVLDKKIPCSFSLTRRTHILFSDKCKELGIGKSETVEQLIKQFIE